MASLLHFGAPGWLSQLSVRLQLRSWSHSPWGWAPRRALCWQLRAWSLLRMLCLPLSLSLPCSCSVSLCLKNKNKNIKTPWHKLFHFISPFTFVTADLGNQYISQSLPSSRSICQQDLSITSLTRTQICLLFCCHINSGHPYHQCGHCKYFLTGPDLTPSIHSERSTQSLRSCSLSA